MRFIPIGSEFAAEVEGIDLCAPFDAAALAVSEAPCWRVAWTGMRYWCSTISQ